MTKLESGILASKPKPKLLSKTELKSSIPKPLPSLRSSASVRAKSASSCKSQPVRRTGIPLPLAQSAGRGKTSASLKHRSLWSPQSAVPQTHYHICNATFSSSLPAKRPATAIGRGPYANIQAKVNSIPHDVRKLKRDRSPTNTSLLDPKKVINKENKIQTAHLNTPREETKVAANGDEISERMRQQLTMLNELKKTMPVKEIQPLELEISRQMLVKSPNLTTGIAREKSFFRPEGSPEYLDVFEKHMGDVTRLWLQLACDLATMKLTMSHNALARLNMPDPSLNAYEEVVNFFASIPGEGELLHTKLQVIEREQQKVISVVMHNGLSLSQECEALRDANCRLEKTQDKLSEELKDKLEFLTQQNQELTVKHARAVDMYNGERAKVEHQEKYKTNINRDINETKKIIKCLEGKYLEWEAKMKKMEAACKSLEVAVRNRSIAYDKESKQHRELLKKFNDAKQSIVELKNKLAESDKAQMALEVDFERLKEELLSAKTSDDDLKTQRDKLMEELSVKNRKLLDAEHELSIYQTYVPETHSGPQNSQDITSRIVMEDVSKDLHQRNLQIQQLKKELNRMEHLLKEKSTREEILLNQVAEFQTKPRENEVVLKSQIEQLQSSLQDMTNESVELEKMVAQKTLELDQRDQLLQQHKCVLQAKDEMIPMIKGIKHGTGKECIERLHAVLYEQQTTYLNKGDDVFSSNISPFATMNNTEKGFLDPFNGGQRELVFRQKLKQMDLIRIEKRVRELEVDRELAFRQEKMSELYSLLELKQMDLMEMERRVRELEGSQGLRGYSERDKEKRIAALHRDITNSQNKTSKSRGFFSMSSGEDQYGTLTPNSQ